MITKDGKYKAVISAEIGYLPIANHAADVRIGCYDSLDDYSSNVVSQIETAAVGPGTGIELFDTLPASQAAEQIMKSVNPGWVDA